MPSEDIHSMFTDDPDRIVGLVQLRLSDQVLSIIVAEITTGRNARTINFHGWEELETSTDGWVFPNDIIGASRTWKFDDWFAWEIVCGAGLILNFDAPEPEIIRT